MAKFKVFMTDSIFQDQDLERGELAKIDAELVVASSRDTGTFIREGKDCDAVLTVYAPVDAEFIGKLEKCRVIVKTGIGVNNIDVAAASARGIMVANVPDYCIGEVADHTFALFLAGIRKINFLNARVREGVWDFNEAKPIPRLQGKIFGLYGFGNIARHVAVRAMAFGLQVHAFDPYMPEDVFKKIGVKRVAQFNQLIKEVDFLSLHVPLTEETRHIINIDTMQQMKSSVFIVNTSRGPLIKEDDLFMALQNGLVAGAALDVLNTEPPPYPYPLLELDNVVVTPHAAFYSEGSGVELREKSVREVVLALTEGIPRSWLNRSEIENKRRV